MVTLGTDAGDATTDGDSAAGGSAISAADACAPALTFGCDRAARDADVATVGLTAIAILIAATTDTSCFYFSRSSNGTAGTDVDVAAIPQVCATNTSTAFAGICAYARSFNAGRATDGDRTATAVYSAAYA